MPTTLLTDAVIRGLVETGYTDDELDLFVSAVDADMVQTLGAHDLTDVPDTAMRRQVFVQLLRLAVELDAYGDVAEAGLTGRKRDFATARAEIYGIMPQFRQVLVS